MKVRHRSAIIMLAVYMASIGFGALSPFAQTARAESTLPNGSKLDNNFIYYYSDSDKAALQNAFKNHKPSDPVISNTFVYVRSGVFGDKPFQLAYDPNATNGAGAIIKSTYWYSGNYKCYVDNGQGKLGSPPDPNAEYYDVNVTAIVKLDENYATNKETFSFGASGKHYAKTGVGVPANTNDIKSVSDIAGPCRPPSFSDRTRLMNTYYNANKSDWPGVETASASTGANGGTGDAAGGDCGGIFFGWLFCQIVHGAAKGIQVIEENFITPFLDVRPLSFANDADKNPQYAIWNSIRNLANGFFVIIFLVFIFATTLRINLNAYAIKKMLPKLVAAAILVQFSYLLMSVAIDITNVFGRGLFDLFGSIIPAYSNTGFNNGAGLSTEAGGALGLAVLAGGVALLAIGAITGTIFVVLGAAFIGALAVFFTLIFRQILIVMLIISAPLAIAAWVLPNTEKFFKTWSNLFIKALLMYPLIVLLFASGKIFAAAAGAAGGTLSPIFALVGEVLPLFLVPMTFKFAGGAMAAGANAIQSRAGGYKKALKDSEFAKDAKARQKDATRTLAAGQGVNAFGRNFLGGRIGTFAGRAATLDPTGRRSLSNFNRAVSNASDTLKSEGLDTRDASMLMTLNSTEFQQALRGGRLARDGSDVTNEVLARRQQLAQQVQRHRGNSAFFLAAAQNFAKAGGRLEDSVNDDGTIKEVGLRKRMLETLGDTPQSMALGAQYFNRMAVENRERAPEQLFTDYGSGKVNTKALAGFVAGQNQEIQSKYAKDTFKAIFADNEAKQSISTSNLVRLFAGPGRTVSDAAAREIQKELVERESIARDAANAARYSTPQARQQELSQIQEALRARAVDTPDTESVETPDEDL